MSIDRRRLIIEEKQQRHGGAKAQSREILTLVPLTLRLSFLSDIGLFLG